MKNLAILIILTGSVIVAVIVGQRMSTDAMAVAVGVVFGVAASIPTSLLIVAATRRAHQPLDHTYRDPPPAQIVVLQAPAPTPAQLAPPAWAPRHWNNDAPWAQVIDSQAVTIIGDE